MSRKFLIWSFVVSLVLSFALYGNTLKGEFVWDDVFFTEREELAEISYIPKLFTEAVLPDKQAASLYRPFTMATFTVNLALHGEKPFGFHVVSILLNALAAWLLLRVVYQLFRDKTLAIFSALFFMFLPIHTEAVALMKARDELLGTVFLLLSWLAFLRATKEEKVNKKWLLVSAGVFFVGVLSKEFVVMAPILFYLVHWIQKGIHPLRLRARELGWGMLFFGLLLGLYFSMRHVAIPGTAFGSDEIGGLSNVLVMVPHWIAVLTGFKIAFIYISKVLIPIGLTASYHFKAVTLVGSLFSSWKAMLGLTFLGGLIFLVLWKKTRSTPPGIGAITFLILYFPISQFAFVGGDIVGERWMYLASIGVVMIAGWFFARLFQWRKSVGIVLFAGLLIWYGSILIPRNLVWRDEFSLFQSMIHDSPKSVRGYSALAQYYLEREMYKESLDYIQRGLSITDQEPNLYVISASIAYKQRKFDKAEELLRKALGLDTFSSAAVINFPKVLFAREKYSEALLWFDDYVSKLPASSIKFEDKLLYSSILTKLGQYDKSNSYIFTELSEYIDHHDTKMLLAVNYYYLGDIKKALFYFDSEESVSDAEKIRILKNFNPQP